MTTPSMAGVRRSRNSPVLWVDCGDWVVRVGDPVMVELAGERVLGEVVIPVDQLLPATPVAPVGRIVGAGVDSPNVALALRERDHLALAQALDCVSPDVTVLGTSWSLDVGSLAVQLAGRPADETELRRRLGEHFRAAIRLDWPVAPAERAP